MIIEFEGRTWEVDQEKISVDEWRELKRKYQMTPAKWETAIGEADPDASTFLYWLMLRRAGNQTVPLGDQLKPDIIALNAAVAKAQEAEAALKAAAPPPEPPPVPTSPPDSAAFPAPGSQTTSTPPSSPPGSVSANGTGSGTGTSSSSGTSTSSPSPTFATSMSPMSGG